jgi:hypothetical protein
MSQTRILLDPTAEQSPNLREKTARLASPEAQTIGLLDISKARGDVFLDHIEGGLKQRGLIVKRFKKPTFARVAPIELKQEISMDCDAVVEALAD